MILILLLNRIWMPDWRFKSKVWVFAFIWDWFTSVLCWNMIKDSGFQTSVCVPLMRSTGSLFVYLTTSHILWISAFFLKKIGDYIEAQFPCCDHDFVELTRSRKSWETCHVNWKGWWKDYFESSSYFVLTRGCVYKLSGIIRTCKFFLCIRIW